MKSLMECVLDGLRFIKIAGIRLDFLAGDINH